MQDRNMDKALEIFSALITGDEISARNKDTAIMQKYMILYIPCAKR